MKKCLLIVAVALCSTASAQVTFSIGTDASLLRNLSPKQKFWAFGQTVQYNLHFTANESAYAWIDYYTEGKYVNSFTATAKSIFTSPQQRVYTATGHLTFRQFSLGWKHYFKGAYNESNGVNIYSTAGFGFLFAKVRNRFVPVVDTAFYTTPSIEGDDKVRKLTFDLGIGTEVALGGNIYAYADTRTWLPASGNESPYLHHQRNVPLPVMLCVGLRLLFNFSY